MSHSLLLPPLSKVADYEGKGNFAIGKYYHLPFSFFYQQKLKMILDLMDEKYQSILDFGSGPAEIFRESLEEYSNRVVCVDKLDNIIGKYDLIVCASVLEFVNLKETLPYLKSHLMTGGTLIGSSPMDTIFSQYYFRTIGNKLKRHSHQTILSELSKHFWIVKKKEWFGLYFSWKAYAK